MRILRVFWRLCCHLVIMPIKRADLLLANSAQLSQDRRSTASTMLFKNARLFCGGKYRHNSFKNDYCGGKPDLSPLPLIQTLTLTFNPNPNDLTNPNPNPMDLTYSNRPTTNPSLKIYSLKILAVFSRPGRDRQYRCCTMLLNQRVAYTGCRTLP